LAYVEVHLYGYGEREGMSWKDHVDKDFYTSQECLKSDTHARIAKSRIFEILKQLAKRPRGYVLDVGEESPLTLKMRSMGYDVDNTDGDLDINFTAPRNNYFTIVFSHVIEHLFNPLYCLSELRKLLHENGKLIIAMPWCSVGLKIGFSKIQYHEIDEYRMRKLLRRAGFEIENITYYKRPRGRISGIRPLIKALMSKNVVYICKKSKKDLTFDK